MIVILTRKDLITTAQLLPPEAITFRHLREAAVNAATDADYVFFHDVGIVLILKAKSPQPPAVQTAATLESLIHGIVAAAKHRVLEAHYNDESRA